MTTLKFEKVYTKGGGAYTTKVNGIEVEIMKTNKKYKWSAFSWCGTIEIECDSLKEIKYNLESLIK